MENKKDIINTIRHKLRLGSFDSKSLYKKIDDILKGKDREDIKNKIKKGLSPNIKDEGSLVKYSPRKKTDRVTRYDIHRGQRNFDFDSPEFYDSINDIYNSKNDSSFSDKLKKLKDKFYKKNKYNKVIFAPKNMFNNSKEFERPNKEDKLFINWNSYDKDPKKQYRKILDKLSKYKNKKVIISPRYFNRILLSNEFSKKHFNDLKKIINSNNIEIISPSSLFHHDMNSPITHINKCEDCGAKLRGKEKTKNPGGLNPIVPDGLYQSGYCPDCSSKFYRMLSNSNDKVMKQINPDSFNDKNKNIYTRYYDNVNNKNYDRYFVDDKYKYNRSSQDFSFLFNDVNRKSANIIFELFDERNMGDFILDCDINPYDFFNHIYENFNYDLAFEISSFMFQD